MTYTINYNVYLTSGNIFGKIIKVHNKENELIAKVSLEDYLKRKHKDDFLRLEITNCLDDYSINNEFMSWFGGMFR